MVLDSGSQLNLVTQACANKLQLQSTNDSIQISGIGTTSMCVRRIVPTIIAARVSDYSFQITFHSFPVILSNLSLHYINTNELKIPEHIKETLVDP